MRRLVALDLPGGPEFVRAMTSSFDTGEAIAPIDQRLVGVARDRVLSTLRPTDLLDRWGERHRLLGGEPVEDGDLVVVVTSGTTGDPKGVVLTEGAVLASASASSERLGVDPDRDHWFCSLPLNHVGGLSVALRAIFTGTRLTIVDRFEVELFDEALLRGATLTSLVPTMLQRLGAQRAAAFRAILLGGSALPDGLAENVVTTYGMTETGSGVFYDGSPIAGVGAELRGEGEIALRGPMLLRTYRDGHDPKDDAGYLTTGDVGRLDHQGLLEVLGRRSELIITGGENVWPAAVERSLEGAPGVRELAVTGVVDREWGERVVALVVPDPNARIELDSLNDRVRESVGPFAAIKELTFVESLPRTAIGKLDRQKIAALASTLLSRDSLGAH